ncbi:vWA domain-containing protein [Corynebacterium uterequi]|uniref:von Willebrand factor type A domain n=1 Tax=Corynebacterium uterequi TaxID=1072256 RepID=A0A0G3HE53_9CORY|nr:vWA domain-containing protein [Corynebacterium uterequi]AKK11020.1 von Willebrand factor type A domain [Corynebacterium uterequi]
MTRRLVALWLVIVGSVLVACGGTTDAIDSAIDSARGGPASPGGTLKIVAATELTDLKEVIEGEAARDLGFDIVMEFPGGTLKNSQLLKDGQLGDAGATWFATNRYVDLIGARDALADEYSTATSPVAFGISEAKARELGWVNQAPTWLEIADAAEGGRFTFGMTDPSESNSGFSALVSVATAIADTGAALTVADIQRIAPNLQRFFAGQTMSSGSSGWLAETFLTEPGRVDAIINYESVLHSMRESGADIHVIVPSDGVVSADYPLSTIAGPDNAEDRQRVELLANWIADHPDVVADSYRRPIDPKAHLAEGLSTQTLIELPTPGDSAVTEALLAAYQHQLRKPGDTAYVLDTSGSMSGERMAALQATMQSLIDGTAATATAKVGLRERESVVLLPFADTPAQPTAVTIGADGAGRADLASAVASLVAYGDTALYDTLELAYEHVSADGSTIPSIVLMSDGEVTVGDGLAEFEQFHAQLPPAQQQIPVFVILYGESNAAEMNRIAELTGGKVFDALNGDLAQAFGEIRGYQ